MPLLFATRSYEYLAPTFVDVDPCFDRGDVLIKTFPDGERYQRIETSVRDRDVVYLGGTINDNDTMEMFDACCAIVAYGARSLTIVIPYFGYSTMERAKPKTREVVTAKTRARLLSAIPEAYNGNRIVFLDLHAEGIPHYFGDRAHQIHSRGQPIILDAIREIVAEQGVTEAVIGSADAGGAKRVEYIASEMGGWLPAFIGKRRIDGGTTEVTNVSADVKGKYVILVDDMTRSGSSLVGGAKSYMDAGAIGVSAILSHGVYTKSPADTHAMFDGVLDAVYSFDSHPRAVKMVNTLDKPGTSGIFRIMRCAPVLVDSVLHHLPRGWGGSR